MGTLRPAWGDEMGGAGGCGGACTRRCGGAAVLRGAGWRGASVAGRRLTAVADERAARVEDGPAAVDLRAHQVARAVAVHDVRADDVDEAARERAHRGGHLGREHPLPLGRLGHRVVAAPAHGEDDERDARRPRRELDELAQLAQHRLLLAHVPDVEVCDARPALVRLKHVVARRVRQPAPRRRDREDGDVAAEHLDDGGAKADGQVVAGAAVLHFDRSECGARVHEPLLLVRHRELVAQHRHVQIDVLQHLDVERVRRVDYPRRVRARPVRMERQRADEARNAHVCLQRTRAVAPHLRRTHGPLQQRVLQPQLPCRPFAHAVLEAVLEALVENATNVDVAAEAERERLAEALVDAASSHKWPVFSR